MLYRPCIIVTFSACQGLTVTLDEAGKVIVARIIIDSVIERQGLLRPGDLILEANSTRVKTPEQLQNIIEESPEFLSLKIQPTLSVSQSQPLNTTEKCSLALPNKVARAVQGLSLMMFISVLCSVPLQLRSTQRHPLALY